jgi:hypothetical protein
MYFADVTRSIGHMTIYLSFSLYKLPQGSLLYVCLDNILWAVQSIQRRAYMTDQKVSQDRLISRKLKKEVEDKIFCVTSRDLEGSADKISCHPSILTAH